MSVAYVSAGDGNRATGSSSTLATSWSHTINNSDASTVVVIGVVQSVSSNSADTGATVTYGGTACTLLKEVFNGSSSARSRTSVYFLWNPPTGTQTVAVTSSGASTKAAVAGQSVAYSGGYKVVGTSSPNNLTISITAASTSRIFAVHSNANEITAVNQTERYRAYSAVSGVGDAIAVQDAAGTGSSVTLSGTGTSSSNDNIGVDISAAPTETDVQGSESALLASASPSINFAANAWVPAANDVVVLFASSTGVSTLNADPSGWVNPLGSTVIVASDAHSFACVYHQVTSAEASAGTRTYTCSSLFTGSVTGETMGIVLRNVDPAAVIDSANSGFNSGNATTPHVLAGLTGANLSTDSLVTSAVVKDSTGTYTDPAGWTRQATAVGTNQAGWLGTRDTHTTSGVDVAATNITPSAGDEYASITVAFTALPTAPTGTITSTLQKATASVSGRMEPKGSIAVTAAKAVAAFTGKKEHLGQIAATAMAATASLTGKRENTGALAATLAKALFSGAGQRINIGAIASTLQQAIASMTGRMEPSGSIITVLRAVVCAATGEQESLAVTGTTDATLVSVSAALTGTHIVPGAISVTLRPVVAAATGTQTQTGTLAATLAPTTTAFAGTKSYPGQIAATLAPPTAAFTGIKSYPGQLAATLGLVVAAATGTQSQTGELAAQLATVLFSATGELALPPGHHHQHPAAAGSRTCGSDAARRHDQRDIGRGDV